MAILDCCRFNPIILLAAEAVPRGLKILILPFLLIPFKDGPPTLPWISNPRINPSNTFFPGSLILSPTESDVAITARGFGEVRWLTDSSSVEWLKTPFRYDAY